VPARYFDNPDPKLSAYFIHSLSVFNQDDLISVITNRESIMELSLISLDF
jgi:hypothetical protein